MKTFYGSFTSTFLWPHESYNPIKLFSLYKIRMKWYDYEYATLKIITIFNKIKLISMKYLEHERLH